MDTSSHSFGSMAFSLSQAEPRSEFAWGVWWNSPNPSPVLLKLVLGVPKSEPMSFPNPKC